MRSGMTPQEAVRWAREQRADGSPQELADHIREHLGLAIKPPIVAVLLGTFQERAALDQSGRKVYEQIERYRQENPQEVKKRTPKRRKQQPESSPSP